MFCAFPNWITNTKNKTEMVNTTQILLENRELCLPAAAEELQRQFRNQQFEIGPTGKRKFYHPTNEHDDYLWASLLALKNATLQSLAEKVKFANPWEYYDENIKGETELKEIRI
jgi:hypothetical protein